MLLKDQLLADVGLLVGPDGVFLKYNLYIPNKVSILLVVLSISIDKIIFGLYKESNMNMRRFFQTGGG